MKAIMICANKYAQQPGVADSPILVVFNGPRGATLHMDCDSEADAAQFAIHGKYQVEVLAVTE